jgi:hypothetical protein
MKKSLFSFTTRKPYRLRPVSFFNLGRTQKKNMSWPQASLAYPRLNPQGDIDRDGVKNMFDCRPFDRKRHIILRYGETVPAQFQEAVSSYFREHPEEKRQAETFKGKQVMWKFDERIVPQVALPSQIKKARTLSSARFTKKRPFVKISSKIPQEDIPKRIESALEFKKEREERNKKRIVERHYPSESKSEGRDAISDILEGKENRPPKLVLKGEYAEDILRNLKSESD